MPLSIDPLLSVKALEKLKNGIIILDQEQRIVFWNPWMERASGHKSEEVLGKWFPEVFPDLSNPRVYASIAEALELRNSSLLSHSFSQNPFPLYLPGTHRQRMSQNILIQPLYINETMPFCLIDIVDVTASYLREELLKDQAFELKNLNNRIQNIREDERSSLAREVHDELGQLLTGIKMEVRWLVGKASDEYKEKYRSRIDSIFGLLDQSVETIQKIVESLRPEILDVLGLIEAIKWQSSEFEKRSEIGCSIQSNDSVEEYKFNGEISVAAFRIFQELLTNVARHSEATHVDIVLDMDGRFFYLNVNDNGVGITQKQIQDVSSMGLMGIRERLEILGGTMKISSETSRKTSVHIKIPLIAQEQGKNLCNL